VWGTTPREDLERGFFLSLLEKTRLFNFQNFRTGNEEVAKRLDRFLISESLMAMGFRFKSKVVEGRISYHRPIILQRRTSSKAPPASLKIARSG
jgi:hypothetical protein